MSVPTLNPVSGLAPLRRVLFLVRYRFFLFAGLLPYLLGTAWASAMMGIFDAGLFWSGLGGVVLAVIGVEAYNEYFDARMGTDRVFNPRDLPPVTKTVLWIGTVAFATALTVGVHLTMLRGWPILAFTMGGGMAAIFYEAPPVRWVYRGLGETVIALAYGPLMVLGSLYLQTATMQWGALWASLVPGLLIMALAVANAVPDYHQDRLVGKRNLVVRIGRRQAVWLFAAMAGTAITVVPIGVAAGLFPLPCLAAMLAVPLLISSVRCAREHAETPRRFLPAMRDLVQCYVVAVLLFTMGLLLHAMRGTP